MPAGLEVKALPPVVKTGAEEYASRDSFFSFAEVKARRVAVILEWVMRYRPEEVHAEFGPAFQKVGSCGEIHKTPWGREQEFVYCYCRVPA